MRDYIKEIDEIKKNLEDAKVQTLKQLKALDPFWRDLFREENREQAQRFLYALFQSEWTARTRTTMYINKYRNAEREKPKPRNSPVYKGVRDRWFDPKNNINERTQVFTSPCQTCGVNLDCSNAHKSLITNDCTLLAKFTLKEINASLFIDSKMPKELLDSARATFITEEQQSADTMLIYQWHKAN